MNADFIEHERIMTLIQHYINALQSADVDQMKTLFHPKAAIYGVLGPDKVILGTPEAFYSELRSRPSMSTIGVDYQYVTKYLTVTNDTATVVVRSDNYYGAESLEESFLLLKEEGKWRIVAKSFTVVS